MDPPHCSECGASLPSDPMPGCTLEGRYRIGRFIISGAIHDVYVLEDLRPKPRQLLLKVLRESLVDDARVKHALTVEAGNLATLESRHVVPIWDFGSLEDGRPYLVTEDILGRSLDSQRPLSFERVRKILAQVGDALSDAQSKGIFFRDFEPANFVLVEDEPGDYVACLARALLDTESIPPRAASALSRAASISPDARFPTVDEFLSAVG